MFKVVSEPYALRWLNMVDLETCYVGQIVSLDNSAPTEGARPLPVAAGASNTTNKDIPLGVVTGVNLKTPSYDTTNLTDKITDASPHGSVIQYQGQEGIWPKGGGEALIQVAEIGPNTIIEGDIFNAAIGTAPTELTVAATGGNSAGTATTTTQSIDVAPVAGYNTMCWRTGANKGQRRILDSTSQTVHTWDKPTYADISVGEKCVAVNGLRPFGASRMQIDSEALYVDCSAALTSDYFMVDVIGLYLLEAGKEKVRFRFNADNFCFNRA